MEETIAKLRTMIEAYQTLLSEANERVAINRAEGIAIEAKAKALQEQLDAIKTEKKKPKKKSAP